MALEIIYARVDLIPSFHQALDRVAREEIYIEKTEAPALDKTLAFQGDLIAKNWPNYYVVDGEIVKGWADITIPQNPRLAHRGFLGMGLLPEIRGQGFGTRLLQTALKHARELGLEQIELSVYTDNLAAIHLYRKCGFQDVGIVKHYRKYKGRYFDCLEMQLFFEN